MIWLAAIPVLAILFGVPAVPMALRTVKGRRAAAAADREAEREEERNARAEAQEREQGPWRDNPGIAVLRERLRFEAKGRLPREQVTTEAGVQLARLDSAIQRHESRFHSGGRPGLTYQVVVLVLTGVAAVVFIVGAILDYLIFRGLHPGGSILIPAALACVAICCVMVGSFLAISARRHGLVPAQWSEYFRLFAQVFGGLLAVGAVVCMVVYAPARSYLADEPTIIADQEAVSQQQNAVMPAGGAGVQAAVLAADKEKLAADQASLRKAQLLDRVSAAGLGALEITLTEVAILGGELIAFRVLLRRREQARQGHQRATDDLATAEAVFATTVNDKLIANGYDHRAYEDGLARLREFARMLRLHGQSQGGAPGGGPTAPGSAAVPGAVGPVAGPGHAPGGQAGGTPGNPVPPGGVGPAQTAAPGPHVVPGTVIGQQPPPQAPPATAAPPPTGGTVGTGTPGAPAGPVTRLPSSEFDETE